MVFSLCSTEQSHRFHFLFTRRRGLTSRRPTQTHTTPQPPTPVSRPWRSTHSPPSTNLKTRFQTHGDPPNLPIPPSSNTNSPSRFPDAEIEAGSGRRDVDGTPLQRTIADLDAVWGEGDGGEGVGELVVEVGEWGCEGGKEEEEKQQNREGRHDGGGGGSDGEEVGEAVFGVVIVVVEGLECSW